MSSDEEFKDDDKNDAPSDDDEEELGPIVLDNGTGFIKAGFASLQSTKPRCVIENVIGRSKTQQIEYSNTYVGSDALLKGSKKLSYAYPMKNGVVEDWDTMETVWKYIFDKELKILDEIEDYCVVLTETPLNPRSKREKAIQVMFETFNVASYYTQNTAVFELFAHGKTTGMVVGSGHEVSYTVPVYQGYALGHATHKSNIGSHHIEHYLRKLFLHKGIDLEQRGIDYAIMENLKQKYCYISLDFAAELEIRNTMLWKKKNNTKYQLPDGSELLLGSERFECAEILFQPKRCGKAQLKSIARIAYDSIFRVNIEVRKEIANTIALCGGTTVMNGFEPRFTRDFTALAPASLKFNVSAQKNRHLSAYLGASILASLSFFKDTCITSDEYEEVGPKIVNRKCF